MLLRLATFHLNWGKSRLAVVLKKLLQAESHTAQKSRNAILQHGKKKKKNYPFIAVYVLYESSLNAVIPVLFFGNSTVKRSYKNQENGIPYSNRIPMRPKYSAKLYMFPHSDKSVLSDFYCDNFGETSSELTGNNSDFKFLQMLL